MTLRDSLGTALRAVSANKLRSALTMLGVVIGVGSVITMVGIGEGTKRKSLENIERMGTNMLVVMPNWRRGNVTGSNENATLKARDVARLRSEIPLVEQITGTVQRRGAVRYGNRSHFTQVVGAEPQIAVIRNATRMAEGGWYTEEDEINGTPKCVLGYTVYQELFGNENALGATVKAFNSMNFEVVGVISYKGGEGNWNPDDQVYIPLSIAMTRLMGRQDYSTIQLKAARADLMMVTQKQIEDVLNRGNTSAGGEPLFRVMNQGERIEEMEQQNRLLSNLLAGIASVSLLVGGIGIMNIMLVSVTERTREIGLRKAIGATGESILTQFLFESIVMCLLGGALGVALGSGATFYIAKLFKVPPVVDLQAILIAFGFSAFVGLFFGFYPALRASKLQPIEALRYE